MSEWRNFTFLLSGEISTDLILETCYTPESARNPNVRETIEGYINHLIDFVSGSAECNSLLMATVLQCIFNIFEGIDSDRYPAYAKGISSAKVHGSVINNFAVSVHESIDIAMDNIQEDLINLLVREEGIDRSELKVDAIKGIIPTDYQFNTFRESTLESIADKNRLCENVHNSTHVIEMLFDYLYLSGLLEDMYYRIMDLYKQGGVGNYNVLDGLVEIIPAYDDGLYLLAMRGEITFTHPVKSYYDRFHVAIPQF